MSESTDGSMQVEQEYDYVIAGAGVAAAAAAKAIRQGDPDGTVAVLGAEDYGPAYRPDLSKTLWLNPDAKLEHTRLLDGSEDVDLVTDARITGVDSAAQTVTLNDGDIYHYDQLLLATGASPTHLDSAAPSDQVIYFRTVADYIDLRKLARPNADIVVVGGGYIGAEVAAVLAQNQINVTLIMAEENIQSELFPEDLAAAITARFVTAGVNVIGNTRVSAVTNDASANTVTVHTEDGKEYSANAVVLGLGVSPNDELGEMAGATIDDGVLVDEHLMTGADHVWAAGDVARYHDTLLGTRRVEHVDQAEHSGQVAGSNMAATQADGTLTAYDYTPIFWSDLFEYGYEAVGDLDSQLDTVENLKDDYSAGVVYYLADGHVRGVLLWNVWDSTDKAKQIIAQTAVAPLAEDELRSAIEF